MWEKKNLITKLIVLNFTTKFYSNAEYKIINKNRPDKQELNILLKVCIQKLIKRVLNFIS